MTAPGTFQLSATVLCEVFICVLTKCCDRTQVSIDQLAVVHLPPHGTDLLQLGLLILHSLPQPLQLLRFGRGRALMRFLLLQIAQTLLLHTHTHLNSATLGLWLSPSKQYNVKFIKRGLAFVYDRTSEGGVASLSLTMKEAHNEQ